MVLRCAETDHTEVRVDAVFICVPTFNLQNVELAAGAMENMVRADTSLNRSDLFNSSSHRVVFFLTLHRKWSSTHITHAQNI